MCGRFVSASSPQILAERFGVAEVAFDVREPDYNVTPRAWVPVVRERARDDPPTRVLSLVRWGLVPSWAEAPTVGDRQINARAETVAVRSSYQTAFRRRRCIVPADAFYEWKKSDGDSATGRKAPRVPYVVRRRDGEPLAFAGLWEIWRDPAVADDDDPDAWLRTCCIVTTEANSRLAPIHDRMPVVLPEGVWDEWLDPRVRDVSGLQRKLGPAPDDWFEVYEVSPRVNKPENNDADLLRPVAA
jgi:putative SOS response-associated peptidase YedK